MKQRLDEDGELMKPKLLDLFCCAGGTSMGYYRAGFSPYGIDNKAQKHYPFPFLLMNALEADREKDDEYTERLRKRIQEALGDFDLT